MLTVVTLEQYRNVPAESKRTTHFSNFDAISQTVEEFVQSGTFLCDLSRRNNNLRDDRHERRWNTAQSKENGVFVQQAVAAKRIGIVVEQSPIVSGAEPVRTYIKSVVSPGEFNNFCVNVNNFAFPLAKRQALAIRGNKTCCIEHKAEDVILRHNIDIYFVNRYTNVHRYGREPKALREDEYCYFTMRSHPRGDLFEAPAVIDLTKTVSPTGLSVTI